MNPKRQLNTLSLNEMIDSFSESIEDLCTYKGISLEESKLIKIIRLLNRLLYNRFNNLVVNDINVSIYNLYFEDVKKVTTEIIIKALQKQSNKKQIEAEDKEKEDYKVFEWNSDYGRALSLRIVHDPMGLIYRDNGNTFLDVVETVKQGFNYYTGEPVCEVKMHRNSINKIND